MFQRSTLILALILSSSAFAKKNEAAKKPFDVSRAMTISYGSAAWNTDSTKIDSAYLIMRDKTSGKLVQIQLEETEPDSSQFAGSFSVNIGDSDKVSPEIFIPPTDLRDKDIGNKKLMEMISAGKLARKPVIMKKNDRGLSQLDVYDTKDQASAALAAYQEENKIMKKGLVKPIANEAAIASAALAEKTAQLEKLSLEAAKRDTDRVRLEQIEKQKQDAAEKAQKALSEAARKERKDRAVKSAEEALALYGQGDYVGAETKFKESVDLDPENKSYLFKYGITLYRLEKFNDALVVMNLAKVDAASEMEKQYYMALIHYRLKELDNALERFTAVSKSGDAKMAPSSQFYVGVIHFTLEKYEEAKKSFEIVIDTSSDPRMDEQAEEFLERIASAIAFKKLRENKFTFTGTVGGMYDSNVLLVSDSVLDQGNATDAGDFRLLTIGDLEYRPILNEHHELFLKANASLTNSVKTSSAPADPWLYNVSVPYAYKGALWSKGFKFTAKPGYESLVMDPSDSGTKSAIFDSTFLALDTTFVMSNKWFANYSLEYRMDDDKTAGSVGPDNGDSNRYTLRTQQSIFLDKARKEAFIASAGYVLNAAKGDERNYNRVDLGAMLVKPTRWNASWISSLNIYQLKYPDALESRTDLNFTLLTGFSKPVREWMTWGVIGSYTKNDSNLSLHEYSKYMILTTATFTTNF